MNITSAKYTDSTKATIEAMINDEKMFVPIDSYNRHYAEILRQVKEGTLTIKDAE